LVIVPLSLAVGLIVYLRAERLAHPAVLESEGPGRLRRRGSIGAAASTAVFGMIAALLYGWLLEWSPSSAATVLGAAGTLATLVLVVVALAVRRHEHRRGAAELIAIATIWGCGYGWLVPLISH
jgi:membrane associated rhomboid family serine protease